MGRFLGSRGKKEGTGNWYLLRVYYVSVLIQTIKIIYDS